MSKKILFLCSAITCLHLAVFAAKEQSCDTTDCHCDRADLSPAGMMIGHLHPKGTWMLSYRYMFMAMDGNRMGTSTIEDDQIYRSYLMAPEKMYMQMHMLMGMYGISERFSVMAMLHFNASMMEMNMKTTDNHTHEASSVPEHDHGMHTHAMGLGDTKLYGLFKALDKNSHSVLLSGGISFPTGSIKKEGDSHSMSAGQRLPYMMQMGSGTFDFMPGFTYLYTVNKIALSFQANSIIRTSYNSLGYRLGNEMDLNGWVAYQACQFMSFSLRMKCNSTGTIQGRDLSLYEVTEPAASPKNYGGQSVVGFAGVNFHIRRGVLPKQRFSVEVGLSMYQNLNGIQSSQKINLSAAYQISF